MFMIGGFANYSFSNHDSATSTGPGDPQQLSPPEHAAGMVFTVESPPVRVSFDGEEPNAERGLLLPQGVYGFPFAAPLGFVSTSEEPATVSVAWLRLKVTREQPPQE
jgi:hypothetical protein